ncbi:hypothetical protein IE077_000507, partial [Cardiosporidium cionae]
ELFSHDDRSVSSTFASVKEDVVVLRDPMAFSSPAPYNSFILEDDTSFFSQFSPFSSVLETLNSSPGTSLPSHSRGQCPVDTLPFPLLFSQLKLRSPPSRNAALLNSHRPLHARYLPPYFQCLHPSSPLSSLPPPGPTPCSQETFMSRYPCMYDVERNSIAERVAAIPVMPHRNDFFFPSQPFHPSIASMSLKEGMYPPRKAVEEPPFPPEIHRYLPAPKMRRGLDETQRPSSLTPLPSDRFPFAPSSLFALSPPSWRAAKNGKREREEIPWPLYPGGGPLPFAPVWSGEFLEQGESQSVYGPSFHSYFANKRQTVQASSQSISLPPREDSLQEKSVILPYLPLFGTVEQEAPKPPLGEISRGQSSSSSCQEEDLSFESMDQAASPPLCSSIPPLHLWGYNLCMFLISTTPAVLHSQTFQRPAKESLPFYLPHLWDAMEDPSIFGLDIPHRNAEGQLCTLAGIPHLSGIAIYSAEKTTSRSPPLFYFSESAAPHKRKPFYQLIHELSTQCPSKMNGDGTFLQKYSSMISSHSWIAICWKTIQRQYTGKQSPQFLVFYWLRAARCVEASLARLIPFAIIPYKLDLQLWPVDCSNDAEKTRNFFAMEKERIKAWLDYCEISLPDFNHFNRIGDSVA